MKQIIISIIFIVALSNGQISKQKEWKYCKINFDNTKTNGDQIIPGPEFKDSLLKAIIKIEKTNDKENAYCMDTLTESIYLINQEPEEILQFYIICHKSFSALLFINPNKEHSYPDTTRPEKAFFDKKWYIAFENRIKIKRNEYSEYIKNDKNKRK
jgi:hypothetical protein